MMDKESGRHRGFGFVNYEHVESVEKVLNGGPHLMEGQVVSLSLRLRIWAATDTTCCSSRSSAHS